MNTLPPVSFLVEQTEGFARWLADLRDLNARIATGPGYRVYFTRRQGTLVILLCGGDKRTQRADIQRAQHLAKENWP